MNLVSIGTPFYWIGFTCFVLLMLALDLGVFHRNAHKIKIREALFWTSVWICLAIVFNVWIYYAFGSETAFQFTTGYLIEKALSVDNIFIFLVIFSYFKVPPKLQHRVLFWGILGAIVLRIVFILVGSILLQKFHWIMYVFGGFLVFTGIKLLLNLEAEIKPELNPFLRLFKKFIPVSHEFHGSKFLIQDGNRIVATPLLMVLVVIEATDLIFAIDSIPAVFAVTNDPFIVYTSNIFAILGLRAMYFVLAGMMSKFHYIKVCLAFVLVFVGVKMLIADYYKIPILVSLGVIGALIAASVILSLFLLRTAFHHLLRLRIN